MNHRAPPLHKSQPCDLDGPMAAVLGQHTLRVLSVHITTHTFREAYTTHYPVLSNHAHYSWLGHNCRDLPRPGITWNCSCCHSLEARSRILVRPSWDTLDTGVVHLPHAGILRMECGRLRTLPFRHSSFVMNSKKYRGRQ